MEEDERPQTEYERVMDLQRLRRFGLDKGYVSLMELELRDIYQARLLGHDSFVTVNNVCIKTLLEG